MSVWAEIRKKSLGQEERLEDKTPLFICHTTDGMHLSIHYPELDFRGRIDGHTTNPFYPPGLGEFYQVKENLSINGVKLERGDTIIGYQDSHYQYDYYLYGRKTIII